MLTVIGKIGCNNCIELKAKLTQEGVEFEYIVFDNLNYPTRRYYIRKATKAGCKQFPMVFKDGELYEG